MWHNARRPDRTYTERERPFLLLISCCFFFYPSLFVCFALKMISALTFLADVLFFYLTSEGRPSQWNHCELKCNVKVEEKDGENEALHQIKKVPLLFCQSAVTQALPQQQTRDRKNNLCAHLQLCIRSCTIIWDCPIWACLNDIVEALTLKTAKRIWTQAQRSVRKPLSSQCQAE